MNVKVKKFVMKVILVIIVFALGVILTALVYEIMN